MKLLAITQRILAVSGVALLITSLSGCGNTMYGFGLDMERAGRRLQTQHDPNSTPYNAGYQTQGYAPAQPAPQPYY